MSAATSTPVRVVATGTAKVGRWVYPARLVNYGVDGPTAERNSTRAGDGVWTPIEAEAFTADAEAEVLPEVFAEAPANADREALRAAFLQAFDQFATDPTEVAEAQGVSERKAKALLNRLADLGIVAHDTVNQGSGKGHEVWQSVLTYDHAERVEAEALFEKTVPADVKVTVRGSSRKDVKSNQARRPGKSTWQLGTPCPQGHILTKENLYVMPSGRKQCQDCRKGFPSRAAKPAKASSKKA